MIDERKPGAEAEEERADVPPGLEDHVQSVRLGHGANCSSIGSVVDTLFASAVVTGAIFAAVCAALAREKVTVVGQPPKPSSPDAAAAPKPPDDDAPEV